MNLYALIIGINKYPGNPLKRCVDDARKMEEYLDSLKGHFEKITIKKLTDQQASKKAIVDAIPAVLNQATDEDVAVLYFSGHGTRERANGLFPIEHDGMIGCMVCHFEENDPPYFLLADKEIRFLLSNLKNTPHLVTIFDCCHSGEIVRSTRQSDKEETTKCITDAFPGRDYRDFIFSDTISEETLRSKDLAEVIPFKNHVHIAACGPSQLAIEKSNGGVFTRYLLELVRANNNQLTYQEITRWAKVSIKDMTSKLQTPTIRIQGKGKLDACSSWLGLSKDFANKNGHLSYNTRNEWCYTRGALMGVQVGTSLELLIDEEKSFPISVKEVHPEMAIIGNLNHLDYQLDIAKQYEVVSKTIYRPMSVFLNDLDQLATSEKAIRIILEDYPNLRMAKDPDGADYFVNIFNQQVYLSLPNWSFQPLAEQIDLVKNRAEFVESRFQNQLSHLVKWHHFLTLENLESGFDHPPIKIEIQLRGRDEWIDITATEYDLMPNKNRNGKGKLYAEFKLRITNTTEEKLYVGALSMLSDLEINLDPFQRNCIELDPQKTVELYKHATNNQLMIALDHYMEVYNWSWEFWNFTFIINNTEDFTATFKGFKQAELGHPLTIDKKTREIGERTRDGGLSSEMQEVREKWGTVKTTLRLKNTSYNIISGDLQTLWTYYTEDEMLAPFISQLYLESTNRGFYCQSNSKYNAIGEDENVRSIGSKIPMFLGNTIENFRRKRMFQRESKNNYNKPVIVAEGDSWFLYPFLIKDILDYVMEAFPVRSLAAAGDELENYKTGGQLITEVEEIQPDYVLISGGGNDIVGEEIQHLLAEQVPAGQPAEAYLNARFAEKMTRLEELYLYFFEELNRFGSVKQVFVHGYDYVLASDDPKVLENGWVNRYMKEKGINAVSDRQRVINHLLDTFNQMLERICANEKLATYLNVRNKTPNDEWYDEIHPNSQGFKNIGQLFIDAINDFEALA